MSTSTSKLSMYVYGRRRLACLPGRELITPSTCKPTTILIGLACKRALQHVYLLGYYGSSCYVTTPHDRGLRPLRGQRGLTTPLGYADYYTQLSIKLSHRFNFFPNIFLIFIYLLILFMCLCGHTIIAFPSTYTAPR